MEKRSEIYDKNPNSDNKCCNCDKVKKRELLNKKDEK